MREIKLRAPLREELSVVRPENADPDEYVLATSADGKTNPSNIRNRVLAPAVAEASAALVARGAAPLPERLTPHSLRRTFASILRVIGEPSTVAMAEMGHASPNLTLSVYTQAMHRDEDEVRRLRALVNGEELADIGSPADTASPTTAATASPEK